ncbi:MAG: S9 family peptidase [Gemmatimonadota bacterium]|jgi:dipeptidyl-peptidase-4
MKRLHRWHLGVLVALLAANAPALAQQQDPSKLTVERIYASREFASDFFGPARWLADGSGYTTVERSPSVRGLDIVKYDPASGRRDVLVPATRLVPRGASSPLLVEDYAWSDDGSKLLIFTNTERVWRTNSRGDYWVLDLATGALRQIGADFPASTLMFAKFSPQGDRVAYVQANDIYVERLDDGSRVRLTHDGSDTIINGNFDWAYEEEFSIQDGFRWSPDGSHIAYWQLDQSGVRKFVLVNYTDSLYPQFKSIPYPKVGQVLSSARIGVVPATGGETVWMDVPGDPRNNYIPRMEWADDSSELMLQHMNRPQNRNDVLLADAATGTVHTVFTDTDPAWVDVVDDVIWLDGGKSFTWVSEKDGWRHVYRVSRADGSEQLLTPWPMDVLDVRLIDEKGGWIYFIASPDNVAQRYLYRSRLDGSGEAERLTPEDQEGWNGYDVSPDGTWAFHTYSRLDVPTTWSLVHLPDHRTARVLVDNEQLKRRVASLSRGDLEFFTLDRDDGPSLDGWMMKPPDFDPSKKYPVLFYVYGEPAAQTDLDRWGGSTYLWHLMLTQQGYIVASVDNRGQPDPRGREWRKSVHGAIGVLASKDQSDAARQIAELPYVDADRIGVWGWSGGGSMTLNLMFRHPEIYKTGMSVAPVPDQTLYDAIYQERYSGTLPEYADGYRKGSPITYADGLQGNLLIVHGTGDDNVHYQGTQRLINRLVALDKRFTMMAYPNRTHGIFEGQGTTLHLRHLLTRYLETHLPPGGR